MVTLKIDDELAEIIAQQQRDTPVEQFAREVLVFGMYSRGMISSGRGAILLEMPRIDFIKRASSLGIPYFDITPEELDAELHVLQTTKQ